MQFTSAKNHWILPTHSNVTSKIVVGFTLRGPPCIWQHKNWRPIVLKLLFNAIWILFHLKSKLKGQKLTKILHLWPWNFTKKQTANFNLHLKKSVRKCTDGDKKTRWGGRAEGWRKTLGDRAPVATGLKFSPNPSIKIHGYVTANITVYLRPFLLAAVD